FHSLAHLQDLAEIFMTQHLALLHICPPIEHVQVGTADVRAGDFDQHIRRLFNFWVRDFFDLDFPRSFVNERFHDINPPLMNFILSPWASVKPLLTVRPYSPIIKLPFLAHVANALSSFLPYFISLHLWLLKFS